MPTDPEPNFLAQGPSLTISAPSDGGSAAFTFVAGPPSSYTYTATGTVGAGYTGIGFYIDSEPPNTITSVNNLTWTATLTNVVAMCPVVGDQYVITVAAMDANGTTYKTATFTRTA